MNNKPNNLRVILITLCLLFLIQADVITVSQPQQNLQTVNKTTTNPTTGNHKYEQTFEHRNFQ
jgi:hypothetical protein